MAVFFHVIGLIGILFFDREFFIRSTPFNLLLSSALLVWTHPGKNSYFAACLLLVFCTGFIVEVIGVNTGLLFGDYTVWFKIAFPRVMEYLSTPATGRPHS